MMLLTGKLLEPHGDGQQKAHEANMPAVGIICQGEAEITIVKMNENGVETNPNGDTRVRARNEAPAELGSVEASTLRTRLIYAAKAAALLIKEPEANDQIPN